MKNIISYLFLFFVLLQVYALTFANQQSLRGDEAVLLETSPEVKPSPPTQGTKMKPINKAQSPPPQGHNNPQNQGTTNKNSMPGGHHTVPDDVNGKGNNQMKNQGMDGVGAGTPTTPPVSAGTTTKHGVTTGTPIAYVLKEMESQPTGSNNNKPVNKKHKTHKGTTNKKSTPGGHHTVPDDVTGKGNNQMKNQGMDGVSAGTPTTPAVSTGTTTRHGGTTGTPKTHILKEMQPSRSKYTTPDNNTHKTHKGSHSKSLSSKGKTHSKNGGHNHHKSGMGK